MGIELKWVATLAWQFVNCTDNTEIGQTRRFNRQQQWQQFVETFWHVSHRHKRRMATQAAPLPPHLTHARIAVRTVPNCNFKRIAYTPRLCVCVCACYHWDWLYNTFDTRVIYTPLLERIVITLANCAILMRSTRQSLARPLHSSLAPDHGLPMTKPDS